MRERSATPRRLRSGRWRSLWRGRRRIGRLYQGKADIPLAGKAGSSPSATEWPNRKAIVTPSVKGRGAAILSSSADDDADSSQCAGSSDIAVQRVQRLKSSHRIAPRSLSSTGCSESESTSTSCFVRSPKRLASCRQSQPCRPGSIAQHRQCIERSRFRRVVTPPSSRGRLRASSMVEVSARGNGRECIPATCPLKKKAATYEPVSKKPAPLPCTERKNLHQHAGIDSSGLLCTNSYTMVDRGSVSNLSGSTRVSAKATCGIGSSLKELPEQIPSGGSSSSSRTVSIPESSDPISSHSFPLSPCC